MSSELVKVEYNAEQKHLIATQIAQDCNESEVAFFIEYCKRTGLDPISKQIYAIKRNGKMTIQSSIDGLRLIAQRSGEYKGQQGPFWCGEDGKWTDVWLSKKPPAAAKVAVLRAGFDEPVWGVARLDAYSSSQNMWVKMPDVMIAKVAEALALRKAFPNEMSGIYSSDEMEQADRKLMYVQPEASNDPAEAQPDTTYRVPFGKYKNRTLEQIHAQDAGALIGYIDFLEASAKKEGKQITGAVAEFIENAGNYIGAIENAAIKELDAKQRGLDLDFNSASN